MSPVVVVVVVIECKGGNNLDKIILANICSESQGQPSSSFVDYVYFLQSCTAHTYDDSFAQ